MSDEPGRRERWSGRYFRMRHRVENWLHDRLDRARWRCCAMPPGDLDTAEGGYHFWRCSLRRGHRGPHRSGNYLWGHDGGSSYSPIERPVMLHRRPTMTTRQSRERGDWHDRQDAKRKAAAMTAHERARADQEEER